MSGRFALIIANTEYSDTGLARLTAPGKDAEDFVRVLKDQDICGFNDVKVLLNQPEYIVRRGIDVFFDQKKPDDLLVLYFSGHGVRDELGRLYLAVKDTIRTRLKSTAIKSDYIREAMDQSRSRRQVLILDCCNSGAFAQGTKSATGGSIGTASAFEGTGYGHVILTASDSMQFAWEGDKVIGETQNSLFTHFLIQGLKGEADRDGDGRITVDDLYDYAYEQVKLATPKQTPSKFSSKQQGEIVLRQSTRLEDIKQVPLPVYLSQAIENPDPDIRSGAVQSLTKLLNGKNIGLARSAKETLEHMAKSDDSRRVSQAAIQALRLAASAAQEAKENERHSKRGIPRRTIQSRNSTWVTPMIIGGSVLILSLCAILSRPIWSPFVPFLIQAPSLTQPDITAPAVQTETSIPLTFISTQSSASTLGPIEPTQTIPAVGLVIVPTDTEVPTPTIDPTPETKCANAPKSLSVGIIAEVVTAKQTVFLRKDYTWTSSTVNAMPPGTKVQVVEGPQCGLYRYIDAGNQAHEVFLWWWKADIVEPQPTSPQIGWVVEGYDDINRIYILPINPKDDSASIYIPPGEFTMGLTPEHDKELRKSCNENCDGLYEASKPDQKVEITHGYWIYRTEISNAQYAMCVNSEICNEPQSSNDISWYSNRNYYANPTFSNYPVVMVSWEQAKKYCEWAGGRLPTSAEWEKAASWDETRQEKYIYPWGNSFDGTLLNYCDTNCSVSDWADTSVDDGYANTAPVESYLEGASPYGVLNMAGNVWEWVYDFYSSTYYSTNSNWIDPEGPASPDEKNDRVVRGGSAWYLNVFASPGIQDSEDPNDASSYFGVGFRCVIVEP